MKCPLVRGIGLSALMLATSSGVSGAELVEEGLRTEYQALNLVRVAGDLEHPWAVAFLPDGSYLVTERGGRLWHIHDEGRREISGVPEVHAQNQGGLLDVVLHPEFESNQWVYLTYSLGDDSATTTALMRARLQGDSLVDGQVLFEQDRRSDPGRHYGSRLAWLPDGTLLMSIGDRGTEPPRAQDLDDHAGTLLRLNADGSVPEDNPFVGHDTALPEIYSYGHRNIQGLIVTPEGQIWSTEHGPRGGDELNLHQAGENYGWPVASKGRDYRTEEPFGEVRSHPDMIDPVYEILPTLAPSGLAFVDSEHYPRWQGNLLAGGLRAQNIRRLVIEDNVVVHDEQLLAGKVGRVRDVRMSPAGYIYVLTDQSDGGLYRLAAPE